MDLKTDPEFKQLIPELTKEEYKLLEKSIKKNGCLDTIKVWRGYNIILDGHKRFEICGNKIPFNITELEFKDKNEAKEWIILNKLGRKNLTTEQKYIYYAELSKVYEVGQGKRTDLDNNIVKVEDVRNDVLEKTAKKIGTNRETIRKARLYKELIDSNPRLRGKTVSKVLKEFEIKEKKRKIQEKYSKLAQKFDELKWKDKIQVIHGDFREVLKDYPKEYFDHIITDLPYVGKYLYLFSDLAKVSKRILKPSGFLIMYSGAYYLNIVYKIFEHDNRKNHQLEYVWQDIIKHTGLTCAIRTRGLRSGYKSIIIYQKKPVKKQDQFIFDDVIKGTPPEEREKELIEWHQKGENPVTDVIEGSGREKRLYEWQQSLGECKEIVERRTRPNDLILDVCGGSGTTAIACLETKRRCIIIEIDKNRYELIKGRIQEWIEKNENKKLKQEDEKNGRTNK